MRLEGLSERLHELFSLGPVLACEPVHGGYTCQNFRLRTSAGSFFLKQYQNHLRQWVPDIKFAERYFSSHGVPVVLPIKDAFGRTAFWFDNYWYSLFPYVEEAKADPATMSDATVVSLGETLAQIHLSGRDVARRTFQVRWMWDRDAFELEYAELMHALNRRKPLGSVERRMADVLERKAAFVATNTLTPQDFPLSPYHLLHGDFIYTNVFLAPDGRVSQVFDFERVSFGPRAFELARSVLINCCDDGLEERNIRHAQLFLAAYRSKYPMSFEEFVNGMRMFMIDCFHATWLERHYLLHGLTTHMKLFESNARRIETLGSDPVPFCREVWKAPSETKT